MRNETAFYFLFNLQEIALIEIENVLKYKSYFLKISIFHVSMLSRLQSIILHHYDEGIQIWESLGHLSRSILT